MATNGDASANTRTKIILPLKFLIPKRLRRKESTLVEMRSLRVIGDDSQVSSPIKANSTLLSKTFCVDSHGHASQNVINIHVDNSDDIDVNLKTSKQSRDGPINGATETTGVVKSISLSSNLTVEQFSIEKVSVSVNSLSSVISDSRSVSNIVNSSSITNDKIPPTVPARTSKKVQIINSPVHIPDNPVLSSPNTDESCKISGKKSVGCMKPSIIRKVRDDTRQQAPRQEDPHFNVAQPPLITDV